jgi:CheY-like chemotaxis protein
VRVLIADDDPVVRLFVKSAMENVGHEVLETADGS